MDLSHIFGNLLFDDFGDLVSWIQVHNFQLIGFVFVVNIIFSFIDSMVGGRK